MKTSDSIEQQEERKSARDNDAKDDSKDRDCDSHNTVPVSAARAAARQRQLAGLIPWPKGVSGNPGGRPKVDLSAEIARACFEQNAEALFKAYTKSLLRGNAYAFKELSDRAYGKMTERIEHEVTQYRSTSEHDLIERLKEIERLEANFGTQGEDSAGRGAVSTPAGTGETAPAGAGETAGDKPKPN